MNQSITRVNGKEVNETFQKFGLKSFQKLLPAQDFEQVTQETIPVKRRKRKLTPAVIFWLMALVGLYGDSMSLALKRAWNHIRPLVEGMPSRPSSEAAFTKARQNLPLSFFKGIFAKIL